ncbi:hypothetical protein JCM10213_002891 [Rhodosporidiobolus nylandii]
MVSLRLNTSPRVPSFSGPVALAAALMLVSIFSEPYWQNFYIVEGKAANTTVKIGAWGACTKFRNTTGITGPHEFCSSKHSGFEFNFVDNTTYGGFNNFPVNTTDDATLFGQNSGLSSESIHNIIGSGATNVFWVHVVAAIVVTLCLLSLIVPPSYLGSETSRLFALQKSGIVTILLALAGCVLCLIAFIVEIAVTVPARNKMNALEGISGHMGNIQWFSLPSCIVMLPAIFSVLLRSTVQNEYQDL